MNRQTQTYLYLVIGMAMLLLPFQNWSALLALPHNHIAGLAVLIALATLSEALSVGAVVGTHQASSSIAFLPYFACVFLFPASAATAAVILTALPTQLLIHKKPLLRAAFNTAQSALSIAAATRVYELLGGTHSVPLQLDLHSVTSVLSLAGLALTFFFLNQAFVGIAIAISTGNRLPTVFARIAAPSGANLLSDALVSPIAIVVALLYSYFAVAGLIMVSLPLLIIRNSYWTNIKLQQANKDLLTVLVKAIETRDPYTSGHSIRVSILARAIAEDMKLSAGTVDRIEMTALVHDIGKVDAIYVPIIRKEGPLTDSERQIIQTHAAKGAEFLKTLASFTHDVIAGVRHHHERYDGDGYPDGISREEIPLGARIIMLCDSIDAMLSDRPYRKALTVEAVRAELRRCSGSQFDPRIVDVILERNTLERAAFLVRPEQIRLNIAVSA